MTGVRRTSGFTLIELLIVTAIFSIALAILAQIFVSFNRLHRKVANAAVLGQDVRFAMELLVREARNDEIDYAAYGGTVPDVSSILKLKKQNGASIWIAKGEPGAPPGLPSCEDVTVAACLSLSMDNGVTWTQITSNRVEVETFHVFVRPAVSPFVQNVGGYANNTQPFVTMYLGVMYKADSTKERVTLQSQTSVSSRVYQR